MSEHEPRVDELLGGLAADWQHDAGIHETQMLGIDVVNWRTLDDTSAPAAWTRLGDWVSWFLRRYEIPQRKIPTCWHKHGALVEELSALHTAWTVSFDTLDGGYGPIGWHERLNVALPRITTWYSGQCADGHIELDGIARTENRAEWTTWIRTSHADF